MSLTICDSSSTTPHALHTACESAKSIASEPQLVHRIFSGGSPHSALAVRRCQLRSVLGKNVWGRETGVDCSLLLALSLSEVAAVLHQCGFKILLAQLQFLEVATKRWNVHHTAGARATEAERLQAIGARLWLVVVGGRECPSSHR